VTAEPLAASVVVSARAACHPYTACRALSVDFRCFTTGRLQARLKVLTHPALLVVDEIGYLPISRTGAMLFFQLMTRRYDRASTVLTSNKGFEEWGDIFGDDVMVAALIDRLVHHCHLVTIRGNSYRMRQHTELWQTLHAPQDPEPAAAHRRRSRQEATTN
jgi:DNA replication protein DnaC